MPSRTIKEIIMSQIDIFDEIAVDGFCGGGLKIERMINQ